MPNIEFITYTKKIPPLSSDLWDQAKKRLDSLAKPVGSLGRLEEMAARLFCIQQGKMPLKSTSTRMYTIAADHGVVEEGIASSPQAVTVQMVRNFLAGGAGVNVLCNITNAEVIVVDAGVNGDFDDHPRLIKAKIACGTKNMANGADMTRDECLKALMLGITLANKAVTDGICVVGMGEMGIGNTTASSALFCALFGFSPDSMTGMGAGVPPKGLAHKAAVIKKALKANEEAIVCNDPIAILAALGGFEIAALAGLVIGASANRVAVMVDGFIATAAYACAERIAPLVKDYCFFCHGSAEAGHKAVLKHMGITPLLDLGLRLGEGSGAALGFYLLQAATAVINDMATLDEAGVVI